MQTAENARTATNDVLTGLTYIDTLVSGATEQGLSQIVVDDNKVTESSITAIRALGYLVNTIYPDGNTNFPKYVISW